MVFRDSNCNFRPGVRNVVLTQFGWGMTKGAHEYDGVTNA